MEFVVLSKVHMFWALSREIQVYLRSEHELFDRPFLSLLRSVCQSSIRSEKEAPI